MANIRNKDINKLEEWNAKELRKLKITVNNRISSLEAGGKPKELPETHPLKNHDIDMCKELLDTIFKSEKNLKNS